MSVLYKVNIQTFSGGFLLGVGTYDEERIGKSKATIEEYCRQQKELPLEQRDIPPMFEIIDADKIPVTDEEKQDAKISEYSKMSKKDLTELCKQRGLEVKGKVSQKELILMLTENDKVQMPNNDGIDARFISADEFVSLSVEKQVAYLDDIFVLPDGVEEGSDEEADYMSALEVAVTTYGGMSVSDAAVTKIKEILDYINGEE